MNLRHSLLISTALSTIAVISGSPSALAQTFTWTGFYAGAGLGAGGGGSGEGEASYDPGPPGWPFGPVNLLFD